MSLLTTNPFWTCPSNVETHVQHVAVFNDVGLPLQALQSTAGSLRVRAGFDEVFPADHLGPDEATRDVRVDRFRRLERRPSASQRPRARLLVARSEEADQSQLVAQAAHDLF